MVKSDTIPSNLEALEKEVQFRVSFLNTAEGHGFIEVSKDEADVFIHLKTMRNFRVYYLDDSQNLSLKITKYECLP